jgi:predicted AAA+ superfamily ATPase
VFSKRWKKMLIKREIEVQIHDAATEFPVIAVLGPRQSGKTTLVQMAFPDHKYILDVRMFSIVTS